MAKRKPDPIPRPEPTPAEPTPSGLRGLWRRARRRWWSRWAVDLAILAAIFWGFGRYQSRNLLDDDLMAPAVTLPDLDGVQRSLSDYRGKTVVLFFWAPWCTVCHLESDNWEGGQIYSLLTKEGRWPRRLVRLSA